MIKEALLTAALLQVSPLPPPAPPGPPKPGTEAYRAEVERYAAALRTDCLSEPGIELAVRYRALGQEGWEARSSRARAAEREVAEAALTPPIDVDRLRRALEQKALIQAEAARAYEENTLGLLRALSPADRIVFARRMTIMSPSVPPPTCPAVRRPR
jgi:hypothetical protein